MFRIDPQSSEPIFEQLVFQVKALVARGQLGAGDKLPSVRTLAREASLNPNTIVRAYDALEHDGVIVRRQGSGCFVTGETSALNGKRRRQALDEYATRAATEAFHLGFSAEDLRAAVDKAIKRIRFPEDEG